MTATPSTTSDRFDPLQSTLTDMTQVLAAESWIVNRGDAPRFPRDPDAEECMQTFVDLFLNSPSIRFNLPKLKAKGNPGLIESLYGKLTPKENAAVRLDQVLEASLRDGFTALLTAQGATWLSKWLRFQMLNPIVTKGHEDRVGSLISDDGYDQWQIYKHSQQLPAVLNESPLSPFSEVPEDLIRRYRAERLRHDFDSEPDFFWCYAFDVYRRGWQYQASANDEEAAYFTHKLRYNALNESSKELVDLEQFRTSLWSWGRYFAYLVCEPEHQRHMSPEFIAHYLLAVRDEIDNLRKEGIEAPVWPDPEEFRSRLRRDRAGTAKWAETQRNLVLEGVWKHVNSLCVASG